MWVLLIIILNQPFTVDSVDILGDYADKQSCLQDQSKASQDWAKTTSHHASFGCIQLNIIKTRRNNMKWLPSIANVERTVRLLPIVKEVFKIDEHVPPESIDKINELKKAVHDQKADKTVLRETIQKLEGIIKKLEKDNEELHEIIHTYNDKLFNDEHIDTPVKEEK